MASTVKVPLLGQANKGTVVGVTIGGFVVAGYLVYRQVEKSKQQSAAATAAAASSYGYASASGYGYGTGYFGYGDMYGYGASGGFQPTGYYGYGVVTPPMPTANTTNAQWTQAAIAQLQADDYSAQSVSAALGAYLAGQSVTAAQATIIEAAIGVEGYPPTPGPNGFPPSINQGGTTGGGAGGGQTTGKGLYWHADKKYWTNNGTTDHSVKSGDYAIAGKTYYWHDKLHYFTLNKKRASPPSGVATAA